MSKKNGSPSPTGPVLAFHDVGFAYEEEPVVEHITLSVKRGDFTALLGPNGSGKTTLIKLALGMLRPVAGTVELFGQHPREFREWYRVGYVPQVLAGVWGRFPAPVADVVSNPSNPILNTRVFRDPHAAAPAFVRGANRLGLKTCAKHFPGHGAPGAGIDASGEEELYSLLRRLNQEQGITVLLVSHDIGAVIREAGTVACINRRLFFHGPPHDLTKEELSQLYGFPVEVLLHDALHEHR